MRNISVVIITYNEEKNIKDCLESVKWADEIIVIDAYSQDRTVEICKGYTDKIFKRPWSGYGEQKNYGLSMVKNEWALFLDADERISDTLITEIANISNGEPCDGYYIPRKSFYLNRQIKHGDWNPDLKLRLVRAQNAKWDEALVHERLILSGNIGCLRNPIYHYTYKDIKHHLKKANRYSGLFAESAFKKGKKVGMHRLFLEPPARFVSVYFFRKGFMDGFAGFVIAGVESFEVFLRYLKLRSLIKP